MQVGKNFFGKFFVTLNALKVQRGILCKTVFGDGDLAEKLGNISEKEKDSEYDQTI